MPVEFDACVSGGGKVRTKTLKSGQYIHLCFPKDGGPAVGGEVKTKEMKPSGGPEGRVYERKVEKING